MNPVTLLALFCQERTTFPDDGAVAVRFDGARGLDPIVTVALPLIPPALAWTMAVPAVEVGAVYRPLLLTVPGPLTTVHVQSGCVDRDLPN